MMKIMLTGATGFLGSHIAEALLAEGNELLCTKRGTSNTWRCITFENRVDWINTDDNDWINQVVTWRPIVIIHAAWAGVSSTYRNDWQQQIENILFQQKLLQIGCVVKLKLYIGVGSQAEYGEFNGCIKESSIANPNTAYGTIKLASLDIVRSFCEQNGIQWYWFRIFSCFGERDDSKWLIPATILKMQLINSMDLTKGEQQYSYVYVKDVAYLFAKAVTSTAVNGIYNISSKTQRSLKSILQKIQTSVNLNFKLNFGVLPYRKGQSMINGGNMDKTELAFGEMEKTNFDEALAKTIAYFTKDE